MRIIQSVKHINQFISIPRVLLFSLYLLFLSGFTLGQNPVIDSLRTELSQSKPDELRVDILRELIAKTYISGDEKGAFNYADQAIELGNKLEYDLGLADAWFKKGLMYQRAEDYLNAVDCYKKDLEHRIPAKDFKGAISTINNIGTIQMYYIKDNRENPRTYYRQALEYAAEYDTTLIPPILTNVAISFQHEGKYDSSQVIANQVLDIHLSKDDFNAAASTLSVLANSYKRQGALEKSIDYYNKAYDYHKKANFPTGQGIVKTNIGRVYIQMKDYPKALSAYFEAKNIYDQHGLMRGKASISRRLSEVYENIDNYAEALVYSEEALTTFRELQLTKEVALALTQVALHRMKLNQLDEAENALNEAVNYAKDIENDYILTETYCQLGNLAFRRKAYKDSYQFFERADNSNNDLKNDEHLTLIALGKARIHFEASEVEKALSYSEISYQTAKRIKDLNTLSQASNLLARINSQLGNHQSAYTYQQEFKLLSDSLLNENAIKTVTRMDLERFYEMEKQELEAERQMESLAYQREIERGKLVQYSLLAGALAVVVILIILYRFYKLKQTANKQLKEKNQHLKELRESEKLFSEEALAAKDRELATLAMASHEKTTLLNKLQETVGHIENQIDNQLKTDLKEIKKSIEVSYSLDKSWDSFLHRFEDVHPRFFHTLKTTNPTLTMEDLKLSAYLKIGMSNKEIANVSHLTPGSVKTKIHRLKRKLNLGPDDNIRDIMMVKT